MRDLNMLFGACMANLAVERWSFLHNSKLCVSNLMICGRRSENGTLIKAEPHPAYHRQDGAICRMVDANPVQGLDHGRNEALSGARVAF